MLQSFAFRSGFGLKTGLVHDSPLMAAFSDQAGFIKGPYPESQEPAVIGNLCQFGLHTDLPCLPA